MKLQILNFLARVGLACSETVQRVAEGCRFLDGKCGANWHTRIDVSTLNMGHRLRDVTAQLFPHLEEANHMGVYGGAFRELGIDPLRGYDAEFDHVFQCKAGVDYGFRIDPREFNKSLFFDLFGYTFLTVIWKAAVYRRQLRDRLVTTGDGQIVRREDHPTPPTTLMCATA